MKQLDDVRAMRAIIETEGTEAFLLPDEQAQWDAMPEAERWAKLERVCAVPLDDFSVPYTLYFRIKWMRAFAAIHAPRGMAVLEVGSGASDLIPRALSRYDATAAYTTANMNRQLTQALLDKAQALPVSVQVIEDDANNIRAHVPPETFDAIVFEHSANDILQAMLAEQHGLDTTNDDWFVLLPEMIRLINEAYRNGTLEAQLRQPFRQLISNCLAVMKPTGTLVISHYMFQYDLDLGYDPMLWQEMLPVIRPWLADLDGCTEKHHLGFDPQWWLFLSRR